MRLPVVPLLAWQKTFIEDESQFKLVAAGRQSGKSYGLGLEAVLDKIRKKGLAVMLSRGERQSVELMEKIKMHTHAMGVAVKDATDFFRDTSILQHTATFGNGSRIIALPANPDTARGYSGDAYLDEFGLHKDSREIWASLVPSATRGYKVRVASTFKGVENKFYELAKALGLHEGVRPATQPVTANGWSGHWVDIYMVREQGAPVDPATLRQAIDDEEVWLQEFCNVPMSGAESFIPLELVLGCESDEAKLDWDGRPREGLFAGFDVGRKKDRSVIVILESLADLLVTRGVIWMERTPFAEQLKVAREVAGAVERFSVDATGIGAMLAEELHREFPAVEPVEFTAPVKERMAVEAKRRFEERTLRIPASSRLRRACSAVKRYMGPTGVMRFDAARTEQGHADEFWALALGIAAASGAKNYVPLDEGMLIGTPVAGGLMGRAF